MRKENKKFNLISALKTKLTNIRAPKSGESTGKNSTPKIREPWVYRNE